MRCVCVLFLAGTYSQACTGLKKMVICIFCINDVVFGGVLFPVRVKALCHKWLRS